MPQFYLATDSEGFRHLLTVATEATKMDPDAKSIEIGSDKASIMTAMQELLTEADNARIVAKNLRGTEVDIPEEEIVPTGSTYDTEPKQSYIASSLSLEQQISALPVAHQFHLASMIMENAREKLG